MGAGCFCGVLLWLGSEETGNSGWRLIRLSWCLLAPYINSLHIATSLSVLGVCRDRFEAFGGFRVTSGAAESG